MNITIDMIKDLNSHESAQMRRFSRNLLRHIMKRNCKAKEQYEQELERNQK